MLNYKNKKLKDINGKSIHDTEKPIDMMSQLILNSTINNEIVLDPFIGIGSTGVACLNTNRKFIGIELDDKYFDIAKNRIDNTYKEL